MKYPRRLLTIIILLGTAALVLISCGDPLLPRIPQWQEMAVFPGGEFSIRVGGITASDGNTVYAAATDSTLSSGVIYRYRDGTLTKVFTSPYEESSLSNIDSKNGVIWATGSKKVAGVRQKYIIRNTGTGWLELPVPEPYSKRVGYGLHAISATTCWFWGERGLCIYESGVWQEGNGIPTLEQSRLSIATTPDGTAYAALYYTASDRLYASTDGGLSWLSERIPDRIGTTGINYANGFKVAAAGDVLFIYADMYQETPKGDFGYRGFLTRESAPVGSALYSIAFRVPNANPDVRSIEAMAFKSETAGYAVGAMTSVALADGVWILDTFPESWAPMFTLVTAGPTGYWAVSEISESHNAAVLYFAPD